jgi:CDP-diacylglycerol--serine O-phosphatidyltransferase
VKEAAPPRRVRRGASILPSLFTTGNLFLGFWAVVKTYQGNYGEAAPLIGWAFVLDMLDGRIARLTGTTSEFGGELDSLADVISFGVAPAVLAFQWGLSELGRVGWAAGFVYIGAAAMRLARFNIQSATQLDKRYFVGLPSPAAAGVVAATVFAWPTPLIGRTVALAAMAVVLVPGALMVSRIRFRSFKTLNLGWGPLYRLLLFVLLVAFIAMEPSIALVILSYGYLVSAFVEMAVTRHRVRREESPPPLPPAT